jgi:hypothetical protein
MVKNILTGIKNPSYGTPLLGHIGKLVWRAKVLTHVMGFLLIRLINIYMKMTTKYVTLSVFVFCVISMGIFTYVKADGGTLSICVNKTGVVYMVGNGFLFKKCQSNDQLVTWNIQGSKGDTGAVGPIGPQGLVGTTGPVGSQGIQGPVGATSTIAGPMGPQGDRGLPAQQGAGNILFMYEVNPVTFLKTDGTVWQSGRTIDGTYFVQLHGAEGQIPVPVNDIVSWRGYSLIDKDGNFWHLESPGSDQAAWLNYGPLP